MCIVENHRKYNYERYCNVLQNCKNANCKYSKWHVSTEEIFILIILMALFIRLALFPFVYCVFILIILRLESAVCPQQDVGQSESSIRGAPRRLQPLPLAPAPAQ